MMLGPPRPASFANSIKFSDGPPFTNGYTATHRAPACTHRGNNLSLDNLAREIVERIRPLAPSGIALGEVAERAPEISAAIADQHD